MFVIRNWFPECHLHSERSNYTLWIWELNSAIKDYDINVYYRLHQDLQWWPSNKRPWEEFANWRPCDDFLSRRGRNCSLFLSSYKSGQRSTWNRSPALKLSLITQIENDQGSKYWHFWTFTKHWTLWTELLLKYVSSRLGHHRLLLGRGHS